MWIRCRAGWPPLVVKMIMLSTLACAPAHANRVGPTDVVAPAMPVKPGAPVPVVPMVPMVPMVPVLPMLRGWPAPQMIAPGAELPVRLQSLRIATSISGGLAETRVRMTFFNPNARDLEGNLQFPLLPGQRITAFALDIAGVLRPAVPVEKARGREIIEATERRRVDPALLEKTAGDNFKLRVYPIHAQGTRVVELTYAEALPREGAHWAYRLPLAYGELADGFDLSVQVADGGAPPQASGTLNDIGFARARTAYQAHVARGHYLARGELKLLLAASAQLQSYVQELGGETYFVAEIALSSQRTPRVLPKVVGLLWDSSGSRAKRQHDAELRELDRYFRALGRAEVRLMRLRDHAEAAGSFKIVNGNWDALRAALQATVYDGASALADWSPQADVGEYLLVSDGLLNYGASRFPTLAAGQRLYALNSSQGADSERLAAVAERSGGRLIEVRADQPGVAAQALLTEAPQLRVARADGAADALVDAAGAQHGMVRVAGKLTAASARLVFDVMEPGRVSQLQQLHQLHQPHQLRQLRLSVAATAPPHPLAAQLWAGYKLHELQADGETQRAAIRRLGNQFGMPTRETSLIVLDRLEDYVRYDVTPPPQYLAAFEAMKAFQGGRLAERRQRHLDDIVRQFEEKAAWWERPYPKDDPTPPPALAAPTAPTAPLPALAAPVLAYATSASTVGQGALPQRVMSAPVAPAPISPPLSDGLRRTQGGEARTDDKSRRVTITADDRRPPGGNPVTTIDMTLKKWRANAPYIVRLHNTPAAELYAAYLDERPSYLDSSAFYLDVADMLFEQGQRELGLRVLSNLAEMELENPHVLRILAYRLWQAGAPELALPIFQKVLLLAEEEPQSLRDLGLTYAALGQYQQAVDQLAEVPARPWDKRFAEIELIALAEMNATIADAQAHGVSVDTAHIDPRLLKNMPLDVRAVLTWDADNSDMDLWVTDPNGERCYYGHRFTYQGGRLSRDFTGGYGPEEFSLRVAKPGKYRIEANFFGSRQQLVAGATTLQVRLSTGFGTPAMREQLITLRLSGRGETVMVGEFDVKP